MSKEIEKMTKVEDNWNTCKSLIYSNLWRKKGLIASKQNLLNYTSISELNVVQPTQLLDYQAVTYSLSGAIKNYQSKLRSRLWLCLFFKENTMRNMLIINEIIYYIKNFNNKH
jgi:hypothetical protein